MTAPPPDRPPGSTGAAASREPGVSIVIPVFNQLAFTRQCLDRIDRHTGSAVPFEVIVVDNGSTDGTAAHFSALAGGGRVRCLRNETNLGFARANNLGARAAVREFLLFLNNDTLVQPGWLEEMVRLARSDRRIGVVGIKQLFPYTDTIHHTGIVFTPGGVPQHLYPHSPASLAHVNRQREYQAVNGACLLIEQDLFAACGGFDEGYVNGYEDVDLCMAVRQRERTVVCCTSAFIYHYGQMTETRTADDDRNAARFRSKWGARITVDIGHYVRRDSADLERARAAAARPASPAALPDGAIYFADDLSSGSALSWATIELALALQRRGAEVRVRAGRVTDTVPAAARRALRSMMLDRPPSGGVQIKWSHYWPQHMTLELDGRLNGELFVINYLFGRPGSQPWDYWLQCLPRNHTFKLPLSGFCRDVLVQVGVPADECHVLNLGYSREIDDSEPPPRRSRDYRFLVVTNSHDLERYGTRLLLDAYWGVFGPTDPVALVVKDYGVGSGDTTLGSLLQANGGRARVEHLREFVSKPGLVRLYRSCDAFVSPHRSEGFGMKVLDAMACGLPVLAPLFGGPTDFCTAENTLPIDFALAPMGDCLDSRSLRITNQPIWCEPDQASLARQLRAAYDNRDAARTIGDRGRRDVLGALTWDRAAERLLAIAERVREREPARTTVERPISTDPSRSPHWLGTRVSVVIPTYNRKDQLMNALSALERQSILPSEFEVIVVDDGSTDGTEEAVRGRRTPYALRYARQDHEGPGAARNLGVTLAAGELVLFTGDDVQAGERLLEEHLLAHATRPEPGAAVLGHVDWPPGMEPNAVMRYVVGEGTLQFAYDYVPAMPSLDFRFFYTTNISLKRSFLVEAAASGVAFDPCFRHAAFEDSELAYRLEKRGLRIHYRREALAYHDHWMDLDSFARREYIVGRMAVVFYRKHPRLDDLLQVRWIGEGVDAVERMVAQPQLLDKVRAIDQATDRFLLSLERSVDELMRLADGPDAGQTDGRLAPKGLAGVMNRVLGVWFDVHRTRGKVDEWYAGVSRPEMIEAARAWAACSRKLEFFASGPHEWQRLGGSIPGLDGEAMSGLRSRVDQLDRDLGGGLRARTTWHPAGLSARGPMRGRVVGWLRVADLSLQTRLAGIGSGRWLAGYRRLREALKRVVRRCA